MKDKHLISEHGVKANRSIEDMWEQCAAPPLRDVLKREHDEAQGRPRNSALEKWGLLIEQEIERDLGHMRKTANHLDCRHAPAGLPEMDGPDLDRD